MAEQGATTTSIEKDKMCAEITEAAGTWTSPPELERMGTKAPLFDWKKVRTIVRGSMCWKCFTWGCFFSCQNCMRFYHRECVFMTPGYPHPTFDRSLNEACIAEWGKVKLLKCAVCLVSEETRLSMLRDVKLEHLNGALFFLTHLMKTEFAGNLLARFPGDDSNAITLSTITDKACRNEYKTVEGYFADFRMILYKINEKYSAESEANRVCLSVMDALHREMCSMIACLECAIRRFDSKGKLLNQKEYFAINKLACEVPHLVVWMKDATHGFMPSKLLGIDCQMQRKVLIIQVFGERGLPRVIPALGQEEEILTYSLDYPGTNPKPTDAAFRAALSNCKKYLENMVARFGENGVVVPKVADKFNWNLPLAHALQKMFPFYNQQ